MSQSATGETAVLHSCNTAVGGGQPKRPATEGNPHMPNKPYPATVATAPLFDLLARWEQIIAMYRRDAAKATKLGAHLRTEAAANEMDRCRRDLLDLIDASRQYDEHARRYGLYAPSIGQWVIGFVGYSAEEAAVRLSDRVANGQAFPGEYVLGLPEVCDAQDHATEAEYRSCP